MLLNAFDYIISVSDKAVFRKGRKQEKHLQIVVLICFCLKKIQKDIRNALTGFGKMIPYKPYRTSEVIVEIYWYLYRVRGEIHCLVILHISLYCLVYRSHCFLLRYNTGFLKTARYIPTVTVLQWLLPIRL